MFIRVLTPVPLDHYAIVIGLKSYANLGDPPPQNLEGPENDADDVFAWLIDPDGGGLPPENVRCIRSRDWASPPNAAPTRDDIAAAFLWLDDLANTKQTEWQGPYCRLPTLHLASGHGFSPRAKQGCLLAGNAAERQFGANIFHLRGSNGFRTRTIFASACYGWIAAWIA